MLGICLLQPGYPARLRKVIFASDNAVRVRRPTIASVQSSWRWHKASLTRWWKASLWNRLIVLSVLVYGVVFSILTTLRIYALSAFAWDLGLYNQAMYTTVAAGRFFGISGIPGEPTQSLMGGHFSPILLLFLVPYALFPSPVTLVVLQSWGIAVAALPIYLLGQAVLNVNRTAFVFALVFLLSPATQGINWFDFHPEAFLLPTLSAVLFFLETRRWTWFAVASVLTLSTIEFASFLLGIAALGGLLAEWYRSRRLGEAIERGKVRALLGALALSIAWFAAAGSVTRALNPQSVLPGGISSEWTILGAYSLGSVPIQILTRPDLAAAALGFGAVAKAWYLLVLFLPVEFLTLRSPRALFCCVPWLTLSLFSNAPSYFLVGNQYPSFVVPFIFYGAILGLARPWAPPEWVSRAIRRLRDLFEIPEARRGTARVMVVVTLVLLLVVSPLGPWGIGSDDTGRFPVLSSHDMAVLTLYGRIPGDASVLTQNNLYPLLSNRVNARFAPVNRAFLPGTSFNATMDTWAATTDYVLADPETSLVQAALLLYWPSVRANFSLVAAADGALLLERGSHPLSFFTPLERTFSAEGVVLVSGSLVHDSEATTGLALFHPNITASHFWYGPFVVLPPGEYSLSYRIKVDRPSVGTILGLPVLLHPVQINATVLTDSGGVHEVFFTLDQLSYQSYVTARAVTSADFPALGSYGQIVQEFNVSSLGVYEFPGHDASGSVQLWFDDLVLSQRSATYGAGIPVSWSSG